MRSIERMWSSVSMEGERPPCRQKIYGRVEGEYREKGEGERKRRTWSSMRAVRGR